LQVVNKFVPTKQGKLIDDAVTLYVGGQAFHGWESVNITKNLDSVANAFSIVFHDKYQSFNTPWPLKPGLEFQANIGKERVVTGYIETLDTGFGKGARSFTIGGRSKPGDIVDCTHEGETEYLNISLKELAETLVSPFGLKVFLSVTPSVIEKFAIKPGEKVFEALDRAARLQGFMWVSTRNGNIRLTQAARARAFSEIHQDFNMLAGNITVDTSKRHDAYTVKGQTFGNDDFNGEAAASPEGSAQDAGIFRHRPLTLIAEGPVNTEQATTRAQWEGANRVAKGQEVTATVQGWQQEDGSLWGINQVIRLKSRFLGLNTDLLSVSIEHIKGSDTGTITNLTLVRPDSFTPQPVFKAADDPLASLGPTF
jgi:prophage tail gpP-like protein